jgi:surface carbohydrate biosynthesis protein
LKRRILYLPVETKARELLGKVLLASKAAERGWQVLLGPRFRVDEAVRGGAPGVYITASLPNTKANRLQKYRDLNHKVANLCEESVVYPDGYDYCQRKLGSRALSAVDLVFALGSRNERDIREQRPESAGKLVITGNPRFDTLLPDLRDIYRPDAERIHERFGQFLLVNTNFGRINPFKKGADTVGQMASRGVIDNEHLAKLRAISKYKIRQMTLLREMLVWIAAEGIFERVVVRPHPTENHDDWREWAAPFGIEVRFEGSANNWMLAADCILHTGCTTGIEGLLLDRPIASFIPEPGAAVLNQSDEISAHVSGYDEFAAYALKWRAVQQAERRSRLGDQRRALGSLIANIEAPLAADRILDALDELDVPEASEGSGVPQREDLFAAFRSRVYSGLGGWGRYRKRLQKFPGLERNEIVGPIATWLEAGVLKQMPAISALGDRAWKIS